MASRRLISRSLAHVVCSSPARSASFFPAFTRIVPQRICELKAKHQYSTSFQQEPSPPRLPPDQQAEFERLQRTANTQEGFNATSTPDFSSDARPITDTRKFSTPDFADSRGPATPAIEEEDEALRGDAARPNTPLRKGAPPEFEGEINPRTGEVGGPKNEPLRWGSGGDYSYNGRVTDF